MWSNHHSEKQLRSEIGDFARLQQSRCLLKLQYSKIWKTGTLIFCERIIVPILRRFGKLNFTYLGSLWHPHLLWHPCLLRHPPPTPCSGYGRSRLLFNLTVLKMGLHSLTITIDGTAKVHQVYPRVLRHPHLLRQAPNFRTKRRRIGTILPSLIFV